MGRIAKKEHESLRLIAGQTVRKAVLDGRLQMITENTLCVDCSNPAACYDHRDYNKPLEVVPVCTSCNGLRGPAKPYPEECDTKDTARFLRRLAAWLYPKKDKVVKCDPTDMNWSKLINQILRDKKGYEVAEALGISNASVSRIKDGLQTNLTWELGDKLIRLTKSS